MGFTIVSTYTDDFASALGLFVPTWEANAGATDIVIHHIEDQGSWAANIIRRNEILHDAILAGVERREPILSLDIDTLVLRDLSGGFSPDHAISVAGWPDVNMGVTFFNTRAAFPWRKWMDETRRLVQTKCPQRDPKHVNRRCDTEVWRPRLHQVFRDVCKLGLWEWNYHCREMHQWERDLPVLRDVCRVLHLKGHGDWPREKIDFAKRLWPEELLCIG